MFTVSTNGFDELQRKLENLSQKLKEVDGEQRVPLSELLNDAFIIKHTKFKSVDEMFKAGGFKTESKEDFAAIPDSELDNFISLVSGFGSWKEMLREAAGEWAKKKMGL